MFESFIILRKSFDLLCAMGRKFFDGIKVSELGIVGMNGDDLIVCLTLAEHAHNPNRLRVLDTKWHKNLLPPKQEYPLGDRALNDIRLY